MAQGIEMRGSLPAGKFHVEHWTITWRHNGLEPVLTGAAASHRKIGSHSGIHTPPKAESTYHWGGTGDCPETTDCGAGCCFGDRPCCGFAA